MGTGYYLVDLARKEVLDVGKWYALEFDYGDDEEKGEEKGAPTRRNSSPICPPPSSAVPLTTFSSSCPSGDVCIFCRRVSKAFAGDSTRPRATRDLATACATSDVTVGPEGTTGRWRGTRRASIRFFAASGISAMATAGRTPDEEGGEPDGEGVAAAPSPYLTSMASCTRLPNFPAPFFFPGESPLVGLIGVVLASLVNLFLASSGLSFVISVVGVLVFVGLTAHDTQMIREWYVEGDDAGQMTKKAIYGALNLYLDFINLMMMLLRLFGERRE